MTINAILEDEVAAGECWLCLGAVTGQCWGSQAGRALKNEELWFVGLSAGIEKN